MKRDDITVYEQAVNLSEAAGHEKTPVDNKHLRHLLLTERLARARFDQLLRSQKKDGTHEHR